jgi:hypothetical protein
MRLYFEATAPIKIRISQKILARLRGQSKEENKRVLD